MVLTFPSFHFHLIIRFMHCKRIENEEWGTVDFVDEKMPAENPGRLVLRTRKEVRTTTDHPSNPREAPGTISSY